VRVPEIEKFEASEGGRGGEFNASLIGQNLETIEKTGWSTNEGETVAGLPLPLPGQGQKQVLQIHIAPPPTRHAELYVWLRGESKPRPTIIHP
jgi:hypothetical protein